MTRESGRGRANAAGDGSSQDDAVAEPMTPARWERIEDLLIAALEVPEAERAGFLAQACAGDGALRLEVESLLAAHAASGPADRLADTLGARLLTELIEGGGLEGETVGRYEIGERLGRGGMGIVYRAWDPKLERHVALKVLPGLVSSDEASRQRLLVEAQTAAGLEHPNICTIYEIGEAEDGRLFIAMPLYDGETLRAKLESGPLGEKEAVRLALHAARGLARAHDRGVIHRDIKPGNLMITRDDTLKILDFGIARPEGATDPWGGTPGTAHYMSPEQVAGASVDARADLWSLGVVLYEMLAGRRPFEGETREAVKNAVAHEEAVPLATALPGVSPGLEALTHALLQKDPSRRPGSAAEVVEALRYAGRHTRRRTPGRRVLGAVITILAAVALAVAGRALLGHSEPEAGSEIRRIAVLPLANLTGDPQQDYLAAAMTNQLITQLARIHELLVISHSAVLRYGDDPVPVREIADELDVDAVFEGSVARSGDQVRITAQLTDGETEALLWARDYTRDYRDLLSLEKEVALEIARAVEVNLSPREVARLRTSPSVSPAARTAFDRGVWLQRLYQEEGGPDTPLERSVEALSRAVELEPDWAEAHAELARAYHWLASGPSTPRTAEYYRKAKAAAQQAIRLDETLAGGHAALAFVLHTYERDWAGAERHYRRALELAPNDNAYRWGWALFELSAGRYEEAANNFRRALEQAPLSPALHSQLAHALACGGRYREVQTLLDLYDDDEPGVLLWLARISLRQGAEQRAVAQFERAVELSDSGTVPLASLAHAYASVGRDRDARALIPELEARGAWIPAVYAALGEPERALDQLEWAYEQRRSALLMIRCRGGAAFTDLTKLDGLAGQPRMQELLRKIDFPG